MNNLTGHELLGRANTQLQQGQIEQAFQSIIAAKALRTDLPDLDFVRGLCFLKMGRVDEAREAFREELRHFPESANAMRGLKELEVIQPAPSDVAHPDTEFAAVLQMIRPYTMLSTERLYALFSNARRICRENIPGNFIECGVAAGGSSALLAYVIKRYSQQPRFLYSFDSFSGMPNAGPDDTHQGIKADQTGWGAGTCAAPEQSLFDICEKIGVRDVVRPVKGFFEATLPQYRDWVGMIALLHLDGDWYSSTRAILDNLYDHVQCGGYLQVDDYGHWDGCRKALHEFEAQHSLKFELTTIDATGVWFTKKEGFPQNPSLAAATVEQFKQDDILQHGIVSQMSLNERFQLYYAIRKYIGAQLSPLRFIEVGSFAGASLLLSYVALRRVSDRVEGIAVEPEGQPQFYDVLRALGKDLSHLKLYSDAAAVEIERRYRAQNVLADLILIDGDHTYEGVYRDIQHYYPLLRSGGVMIFHDFLPALDQRNQRAIFYHHGDKEPGIRRACQELMETSYGCEVLEIPLLYPSDPTQTQAQLPIIPEVYSTLRVYRKR